MCDGPTEEQSNIIKDTIIEELNMFAEVSNGAL